MIILITFCLLCLIASFVSDRKKTLSGIKKGMTMFLKLLPTILSVIIIISVILYLIPNEVMLEYFGESSGITGYVFAALIGSIALVPGFIAYPVCGYLVKSGVGYPVIAVFITTLMMVGIITFPIERKFFGFKVALLRNILSLAGALIIGILIGLFWNII